MVSNEQKEKKRQFILNHLEKYVVDLHGNFFNINPEMLGEGENSDYCYIGADALTSEGARQIKEKMGEMILREIKDWELIFNEVNSFTHFRHKKSRKEIHRDGLNLGIKDYQIIGELGYRKNIWENYEEKVKTWGLNLGTNEGETQENPTPTPSENTPPTPNQEPENSENNNNPPPNQEQPEQPTNSENKNNNNEPTNKDNPSLPPPNQETNPSLPSSTDIQNNYNSDKDKSEIDNNTNLTNPEQKEQANELLKLIITAELLIKETKLDSETLSQLIKEKEQNNTSYQILNKEGRINKVINDLTSIQKSQENDKNDNSSVDKNKKQPNNKIPAGLIWGGVLLLVIVGIGGIVWVRKKKLKNKSNQWRKSRKKKI